MIKIENSILFDIKEYVSKKDVNIKDFHKILKKLHNKTQFLSGEQITEIQFLMALLDKLTLFNATEKEARNLIGNILIILKRNNKFKKIK